MQPPPENPNNPNAPQYVPPPPAGSAPAYGPQGYPPPPPGQYPYAPPPPRRIPWWAFVLGGCGCLVLFVPILAAILFPVFAQAREAARATSCLSNQKQMALALMMYTQDYDERLPGRGRWMDNIEPYLSRRNSESSSVAYPPLHCPSVSMGNEGIFGYAFDSRLSYKEVSSIQSPRATNMTYDSSTLSRNATDPFASLPNPGRHRGRNLGSFVDGHASALGQAPGSP